MGGWLTGPIRGAAKVLLSNESSGQIAAGVALGLMLGLAPKATLTAVALGVLICALRVNRAAAFGVAAAVAPLAPMLDSFTHKLGLKVLTLPSLQPTYAWLYDAPLGPWWGLHNTVACGSLLVGLYLSYPLYLATRATVDRLRPGVVRWLLRWRATRWLMGVDVTTRLGSSLGAAS